MKRFIILSILIISTTVRSAEDIRVWSDFWKILATDAGCSLERDFSNERAQEANEILGSDFELFDRFFLWFYIPSHTRETFADVTYIENELYFSINSQLHPKVNEDQQRINSVHINGVEINRPNKSDFTSYRQYIVHGQAAHEILNLFESGDKITMDLGLSGGEVESLVVPSNSEQRFGVWSKLLFVCAEEISPTP
jgi:hypothetical protein